PGRPAPLRSRHARHPFPAPQPRRLGGGKALARRRPALSHPFGAQNPPRFVSSQAVKPAGLIVKLVLFFAFILAALWLVDWIKAGLDDRVMPMSDAVMVTTMLAVLLIYMLVTATPFLPGAEIGLLLLTGFGASAAPLVYGATVLALSTTFLIGRLVPGETSARALETLRLHRAAALLRDVCARPVPERLDALLDGVESPWLKKGTRYRYLALALLLNMPGNVVIGGGGGLALVAGLSRVFHPGLFVLTVALAVLPVPLFVLLVPQ
ncbi:MAG: hypothetical protein AAF618_15155, partial [Pseudomonadota bacterium]